MNIRKIMITVFLVVIAFAGFVNIAFGYYADVNNDGKVDLRDVFLVAKAYGSNPYSPNWNEACDLDKNGIVDLRDYFSVARDYSYVPDFSFYPQFYRQLDTLTWNKHGIVIEPDVNSNVVVEPSVLYEDKPQILTNCPKVFKMWYRQWCDTLDHSKPRKPATICYAESIDGINWIEYVHNPVLNGSSILCMCPFVFNFKGTYYLYVLYNSTDMCRFHSSNGLSWILDKKSMLTTSKSAGDWDSGVLGNCYVWVEGFDSWKMIYEANNAMNPWQLGYASSSDGLNWTKHPSPILTDVGSCGGPYVCVSNSIYYMMYHHSPTEGTPTDIFIANSTDLITWRVYEGNPIIKRTETWEGYDNHEGQVADPSVLSVNNTLYVWYAAVVDQSPPPNQTIALITTEIG